jgi:tetratricopeptide (TPR) repeat protein
MRLQRGLVLALGVAAVSAACAAGSTGGTAAPAAAAATMSDVTCTGATPSAATRTAQGALNRTMLPGMKPETQAPYYQQAITAVQAEMTNPYNLFIAGQAHAGLGHYAAADSAFAQAVQLCPGFAEDVREARRGAYTTAFNAAVASLNANDTATAITGFNNAITVFPAGSDALFNLGLLYYQTGDPAHAVQYYNRTLTALRTPEDTTEATRLQAVETRGNVLMGLLGSGSAYFQKDQFGPAADVFRSITQADPNSRDAWYNLALALYKQNRFADLLPVAQRLTQIDPLNYNAQIILFNAYKGLADAAGTNRNDPNRNLALSTLAAADSLPVQVEGVRVENNAGTARLTGTAVGGKTPAGRPVSLEFTFYGATGRLGAQTVTFNAPAKDQRANFEVSLPTTVPATSFSYRVTAR